jgi:hypothetical protein
MWDEGVPPSGYRASAKEAPVRYGVSGTSRSFRRAVVTRAPVAAARILPSWIARRTSAKLGNVDPGRPCSCRRNPTSMVADSARATTVASSARKRPGPVERLEQPDCPGSHHQTPCGSPGSTATHNPGGLPRTSIGAVVTMYRGIEADAGTSGIERHATAHIKRPTSNSLTVRRTIGRRGDLGAPGC